MIAQPQASAPIPPKKSLVRRLALPLAAGGVSGFLAAMAFLEFAEFSTGEGLGISREIAGLVGVIYILTGLVVALGAARPSVGAKLLNVEDADELREGKRMLMPSSAAMVLLGGVLILLALAGPVGPLAPGLSVGGAVLMLAIASWLGTIAQRLTDEMQRDLNRDATASAFSLLLLIGGGWAMLAHTDFVTGPAPFDWLTMFSVVLLLATFWQAGRRGLMTRGPN
jgi:hypothetical protein